MAHAVSPAPVRTGQRPLARALSWLLALWAFILSARSPAIAASYWLPPQEEDVIGAVQEIEPSQSDTFVGLASRYGVGFEALVLANPGVDPWLPNEARRVRIPTLHVLPQAPREGIVLNVPEMRLYFYPQVLAGDEPAIVHTFPVSVGRRDWLTPVAMSHVVAKVIEPSWRPPESIRAEHRARGDPLPAVVPPGPHNPLGRHALRLNLPGYLIHGTNKPHGIGMRVTHGCIRMLPADIESLFNMVGVGTPVRIVDQPLKAGWRDGLLYLEAHPRLTPPDGHGDEAANLTELTRALVKATGDARSRVDWVRALEVVRRPDGIPRVMSIEPVRVQRP